MNAQKKRIDKDALAAEANCIEVARYIGIDVQQRGANYFMLCPGHEARLGKPDTKIGNCVVYPDGYVCFACNPNKKFDVFQMVQEYLNCNFVEALKTVASLYGGEDAYKTNQKVEKLTLSTEDLKLIGLKPSVKVSCPINGSKQHFEPPEGTFIEKKFDEYLLEVAPSSASLLTLKKENEGAFNFLIKERARLSAIKYKKALENCGTRNSPNANLVFDLFNENGGVDDAVFYGIQNALKKKILRCKEIYEEYSSK